MRLILLKRQLNLIHFPHVLSLNNPLTPVRANFPLSIMPEDFTRQWEVKVLNRNGQ